MKVKELIEALSQYDENLPVYIAYEYGDYWGSIVAKTVNDTTEQDLVWSEYHQKMQVPSTDEESYDDDETMTAVVLG